MELNDLRSLITLASFAVFVGIVIWAFSKRRKQDFTRAANSVFEDEGKENRDE